MFRRIFKISFRSTSIGLLLALTFACTQAQPSLVADSLLLVPPVSGLESNNAKALANAMASDLTTRGIPAKAGSLNEGIPADAFVMGRVDAVEERHSLIWMMVRWSVMTPDGGTVQTIEKEVVVDQERWLNAEPLTMGFAISETGPEVMSALAEIGIAPPAPPIVAMEEPITNSSETMDSDLINDVPIDVSTIMEEPGEAVVEDEMI